jgi:hypothetical protein
MINAIKDFLVSCQPVVMLVALACGVIGAWGLGWEIANLLGLAAKSKVASQPFLIGGACLAIISGNGAKP